MAAEIEPEGRERVGGDSGRPSQGAGMEPVGRGTDGLPRLGGIGALLSGLLFLVTVLYTFVYLARLGLSTEMPD